jgi:hypothetical protein
MDDRPDNPYVINCAGWVSMALGMRESAIKFFKAALVYKPDWTIAKENLVLASQSLTTNDTNQADKFLLIKAWGYGFWSDVTHVLGQLVIAEITGRVPVVHWGSNSLFFSNSAENAFNEFFQPISSKSINDITSSELKYWPPKWNSSNLHIAEINKFFGPYSKFSSLYFIDREEDVIVSDFFTPIYSLLPYIPEGHFLKRLSISEIYRYLIDQYLAPHDDVTKGVDSFIGKNFSTNDYLAVHIRGSDKVQEDENLARLNSTYRDLIDSTLTKTSQNRFFLMTDDERIMNFYKRIYGDDVRVTESVRTKNDVGVHFLTGINKRQLGLEVMTDVYIAGRARYFIGNSRSNPSLIVANLKQWLPECLTLLGGYNSFENPGEFINVAYA